MVFLSLFQTCGLICGPLMFLAGIVAVVLCFRATRNPSTGPLRRAVCGSISPLVVGIVGALVGLAVALNANPPGGLQDQHWMALGKVVLSGLTVAAIPMLWCLALLKPRAA